MTLSTAPNYTELGRTLGRSVQYLASTWGFDETPLSRFDLLREPDINGIVAHFMVIQHGRKYVGRRILNPVDMQTVNRARFIDQLRQDVHALVLEARDELLSHSTSALEVLRVLQ